MNAILTSIVKEVGIAKMIEEYTEDYETHLRKQKLMKQLREEFCVFRQTETRSIYGFKNKKIINGQKYNYIVYEDRKDLFNALSIEYYGDGWFYDSDKLIQVASTMIFHFLNESYDINTQNDNAYCLDTYTYQTRFRQSYWLS